MANQFRMIVQQEEFTEDDCITQQFPVYTINQDYQDFAKETYNIGSVNDFKTINFNNVAESQIAILRSTVNIDIRINGSANIIENVRFFVLQGSLTSLEIRNQSGETATITKELYGDAPDA